MKINFGSARSELLELKVGHVGTYFSKLAIRILYVVNHKTRNKWTVKWLEHIKKIKACKEARVEVVIRDFNYPGIDWQH